MSWPERCKCHTIHWPYCQCAGTKTPMFWWRLDEFIFDYHSMLVCFSRRAEGGRAWRGSLSAPGQLLSQGSPLRSPGKPSAEERRNLDRDPEQRSPHWGGGGGGRKKKRGVRARDWSFDENDSWRAYCDLAERRCFSHGLGFALKSERRKRQQRCWCWWCSYNAKVLRIAPAYTHCEPAAAASLTLIPTEGDITISKGAAGDAIARQQCDSRTGRSEVRVFFYSFVVVLFLHFQSALRRY